MSNLCNRLKQLRAERHVTPQLISEKTGLTVRAYQYYERGNADPSAFHLVLLANFF